MKPCHLTPAQLLKMRDNAIWAVKMYAGLGLYKVALRYERIAIYLENRVGRMEEVV